MRLRAAPRDARFYDLLTAAATNIAEAVSVLDRFVRAEPPDRVGWGCSWWGCGCGGGRWWWVVFVPAPRGCRGGGGGRHVLLREELGGVDL